MNVTLLGNRVITGIISYGHTGAGQMPTQYEWGPYEKGKFGQRHSRREMPRGDEGRDKSNASTNPSTSQGMPKIASKSAGTIEAGGRFFPHSPHKESTLLTL